MTALLPVMLLGAAVGIALGFSDRRAAIAGCFGYAAAWALAAGYLHFFPIPETARKAVYLGCLISVAVTAATVYSPRGVALVLAIFLSLNAATWITLIAALDRNMLLPGLGFSLILLCFPSLWLARSPASLLLKVVASWLLAIALLTSSLTVVQHTPGYLPDHME